MPWLLQRNCYYKAIIPSVFTRRGKNKQKQLNRVKQCLPFPGKLHVRDFLVINEKP